MTLYLIRPLTGCEGLENGVVPVLMYHGISDDREPGVSPYYQTTTSPAVFEQQMRWLKDAGFRGTNLDQAFHNLEKKGQYREKPVVITFDDGFRDFYDIGFPILKKHGHTAIMFLATAFIGENRRSFKGKECMTWAEVRELRTHGIRFGSHTVNHPVLYQLGWEDIESELARSKQEIEQQLGEEITSFAYPYAFPQQDCCFTDRFAKLLASLGYRRCYTTMVGRAQAGGDPFRLKRLPVNGCDDDALLAAKLQGCYDWVSYPQGWSKTVRGWLKRTSGSSAERASRGTMPVQKSPQEESIS